MSDHDVTQIISTLPGLRQFLVTESPLKMMKNAFYFTSKALFILKIFKFLSWLFGLISKRLDLKDQISFKFYDVTAWLTDSCNTHNAQYRVKKGNQTMKFGHLVECNMRNIILEKSYTKCGGETSPRPFFWKIKIERNSELIV